MSFYKNFILINSSLQFFRKFGSNSLTRCHLNKYNNDLFDVNLIIHNILSNNISPQISSLTKYYFNSSGKSFRPVFLCLVARASNILCQSDNVINLHQLKIAAYSEMIHTASLLHDDVVDQASQRRSNNSANLIWGQRKPILTGNLILALASRELACIQDIYIIKVLSQVLFDMVNGELMQLGSKQTDDERFEHYFQKTFYKAGSLLSNSAKCVSYLSNQAQRLGENNERTQLFYELGKHIGMAFQIRDDILDFKGLKTGKDIEIDMATSGLANAPLLFACEKFPEVISIIQRKFSQEGDIEKAMTAIIQSNGIEEAQKLVVFHVDHAKSLINQIFHLQQRNNLHPDYQTIKENLLIICESLIARQT